MATPTLPIRDSNPVFYTRKQVAQIIGVDHSTISRWETKGLITSQRYNGMCLYTESDLQKIKEVAEKINTPDVDSALLCTICNHRRARQGTTICSRCSFKKVRESLRDTLPGMSVTNQTQDLEEGEEQQIEDPNNRVTEVIAPGQHQYTRKQVADMIGVSPTTISRWEAKGATPLPRRLAHNNQYVYTDDLVHQILDYAEKQLQVQRTPIERAARRSARSFGKAERAVATRIKSIGGRGLL